MRIPFLEIVDALALQTEGGVAKDVRFSSIAFGGGKYRCPGQSFAYLGSSPCSFQHAVVSLLPLPVLCISKIACFPLLPSHCACCTFLAHRDATHGSDGAAQVPPVLRRGGADAPYGDGLSGWCT